MIYKIGLIIGGLIITLLLLVAFVGLALLAFETQRDIMAEEYQKMYDELKSETELDTVDNAENR